MVERDFSDVTLWRLGRNAGFSVANNMALRRTTAPFVLLLNPDAELRPSVLDHMIELLEGDARIGMAGCRLVQTDGTFDHAAKRSFPTPLAALAHFLNVGRWPGAPSFLAQYRAPEIGEHALGDVDAVNGAFMFVRREALEDVGLLDPGYWLYMEDLDWCYRFHQRGWRVVYDGRVTAMHVKGGTSGRRRAPKQNLAFHRGMGRFYRKFQAGRRPAIDLIVYIGIGAKLAVSVMRNALSR